MFEVIATNNVDGSDKGNVINARTTDHAIAEVIRLRAEGFRTVEIVTLVGSRSQHLQRATKVSR